MKTFEVFIAKGQWKDRNEDLYYCGGGWSTSITDASFFFSREVLESFFEESWQDVENVKVISAKLSIEE